MPEKFNYSSLLVISVIAFITPFLVTKLKRLKIPFQVGEIIIGVIVGKTCLNLVHQDVSILFLSNLGLAYLMFLIGLEVNFNDLKPSNGGATIIKMPLIMLVVSFITALFLTYFGRDLLGLTHGYVLIAFIFLAAAAGLVGPILKAKNLLSSELGQILLTFSILCQFTSILGTTVIFSISENGLTIKSFEFMLIFIFAAIAYFISHVFLKRHDLTIPSFKNIHLIVRAAFALILILVVVAEQLNTEIVLGAFLAGMIFSLLTGKAKEEISHQLNIIGYGFLIPIFFIMIGVKVDLKIVFTDPSIILKAIIMLIIFFIVKFIPSLLLRKKFGMKKAVSSSVLLSAQLSIVIVSAELALKFGFITNPDYSAFILTTIASCILFPILYEKLAPSEETESEAVTSEITVREVILNNDDYENKPLKDCNFKSHCRIFSYIRHEIEVIPNGDSILHKGDILVLVGSRADVESTVDILEK